MHRECEILSFNHEEKIFLIYILNLAEDTGWLFSLQVFVTTAFAICYTTILMEVQKCSWESNIPTTQHSAMAGFEFTTSAIDESMAQNVMGIKSSPQLFQQPAVFTGNNTAVKSSTEPCDGNFQVCRQCTDFI